MMCSGGMGLFELLTTNGSALGLASGDGPAFEETDPVLRCPFRDQGEKMLPRVGEVGLGLFVRSTDFCDTGGMGLFSFELTSLPGVIVRGGIDAFPERLKDPVIDFVFRCSRFFMNGSLLELLGGVV